MPAPSRQSLVGLDFVNLFMADVRDGVGVYLSVYLIAVLAWDPAQVGWVVAIPGLVAIAVQAHAGALLDDLHYKRLVLVLAALAVAVSCGVVLLWPTLWPVAGAQALIGLVGPVFQPCVSALSLGLVGHAAMRLRVGRNEALNHLGNLGAALIALVLGLYGSFEGIFAFTWVQCALMIVAVLMIRGRDVDHERARSAAVRGQPHQSFFRDAGALLAEPPIAAFIAALTLWNVANGFLLPMLGLKLGITDLGFAAAYLAACIIVAQAVMVFVAPLAARLSRFGRKQALLIAFVMIPVRAALFSMIEDRGALIALQVLDGIGAGFYGVVGIVMMADLARGSGRFNLLQGLAYTFMGVGGALSSVIGGLLIQRYGYDAAFVAFAGIGVFATAFYVAFVGEPAHAGAEELATAR